MDQQELNSLHVGMSVATRRSNLKDCVDVTEEKSANSMVVGIFVKRVVVYVLATHFGTRDYINLRCLATD